MSARFDPAELTDPNAAIPPDAELAIAAAIGRELESRRGAAEVRPSPGFVDDVMAAIAAEASPVVGRGWFSRWSPATTLSSVVAAWHVAIGGSGQPTGARAAALAYVLVAVVGLTAISGAAAFGVAGALGIFDSQRSPSPSQPPASLEASPSELRSIAPSSEPSPSPSVAPTQSSEPSPAPSTASPAPGSSPRESEAPDGATASPSSDPTDEPESSDDHGDSSPSPSDTPEPSGSDDTG